MSAMGGKMSSEELAAIEAGMAQGENTMSMVERVARAICLAEGLDPDADWRERESSTLAMALPQGKEQRWRTYVRQALAAIAAMGAATADMQDAGATVLIEHGFIPRGAHLDVWSAMLDAALKEEPKP
jgi:alkylhydroperoxidase/carboxymuconolactone decarboxylase family protein YurZ